MDISKHYKIIAASLLYCGSQQAVANSGPWFTGPLLAPSGHTIPAGHNNLEIYGFHTKNEGLYKRHWKLIQTPGNHNDASTILFTRGLADRVDIQYSIPFTHNVNEGYQDSGVGDISVILGIQVLEQKNYRWWPDLRMGLQQIFPAGRYDHLNPDKNGTDSTGLGSYRSSLELNFQHLLHLYKTHYFRTRLSLNYINASSVKIDGLSTYGGTINTSGKISPGNLASIDLAGELTVTQHWVAVMEGFASKRDATRFKGIVGQTTTGMPVMIGNGRSSDISLAPAIEFNYNSHIGVIAGAWFSLPGNNSVKFLSSVIALNAYW